MKRRFMFFFKPAAPAVWLGAALVALSVAWWLPTTARAHGSEDHGDGAPPAAAQAGQAPRASAQTDEFELVAVLTTDATNQARPATLTIYLDRFATNEPVSGAAIEIESGAVKATARAVAPGVYSAPAAAWARPGRYPLTVSVQTDDGADLLDMVLTHGATSAESSEAAHPGVFGHVPRWGWIAAAAAALAMTWVVARRRASAAARHTASKN